MGIIKTIGTIEKTLDKDGIIALAESNAEEVMESGKFDMLHVYTELKRYELYLKTIIEKTKDVALEKVVETGEKTLEINRAKISILKRTTYDFSGDRNWSSIKGDIDFLTNQRKEREAFLKNMKPGETIETVDEATGEIISVTAPISETKYGLMVRL